MSHDYLCGASAARYLVINYIITHMLGQLPNSRAVIAS